MTCAALTSRRGALLPAQRAQTARPRSSSRRRARCGAPAASALRSARALRAPAHHDASAAALLASRGRAWAQRSAASRRPRACRPSATVRAVRDALQAAFGPDARPPAQLTWRRPGRSGTRTAFSLQANRRVRRALALSGSPLRRWGADSRLTALVAACPAEPRGQAGRARLLARLQAARRRHAAPPAQAVGQRRGTDAHSPYRFLSRAPLPAPLTRLTNTQDGEVDFREFIVGIASWETFERGFGRLRLAFRLLDNVRQAIPRLLRSVPDAARCARTTTTCWAARTWRSRRTRGSARWRRTCCARPRPRAAAAAQRSPAARRWPTHSPRCSESSRRRTSRRAHLQCA